MTHAQPSDRQAQQYEDALKVTRMYYHLGLTTTEIAKQLGVTRPTVSRLLSWARTNGLIEFKIHDHAAARLTLERDLEERYDLREVKVVPVPPDDPIDQQIDAVALFTANFLGSIIGSGSVLAVAWGATISQVSSRLTPRPVPGMSVVQLTGSGNNNSGHGVTDATRTIAQFAQNWHGHGHLLPIPAYFDNPNTKEAMYEERVVRRVKDLAQRADIALFSIGVPDANSYIYRAGYVEDIELQTLRQDGVVGDIATVFFREDGTYRDIAMNERSTGPDLASLREHPYSICAVAGKSKLSALRGALTGGFMNTLIIDEGTALNLL